MVPSPGSAGTVVPGHGGAGGSWLAGLTLSTSLGLRGPALTGLILTLASLVPLTLLAAAHPSARPPQRTFRRLMSLSPLGLLG